MRSLIAALLVGSFAISSEAAVTRFEINRREVTFEGAKFGSVGAYEKIIGRFWAELDPASRLNSGIVDLNLAPVNAAGKVEYSAEFYILTPVDRSHGNRTLLYEVPTRGDKNALWMLNHAPLPLANDPSKTAEAGDGFLMRHGYTLVWSGVYGDVTKSPDPNFLTIDLPIAKNTDGTPITGEIWDECSFHRDLKGKEQCPLSYAVPDLDKSSAKLLVRERRSDTPIEIPREQWEFAGPKAIRLLPGGELFKPGLIYQFIHRASDPRVEGIGLASIRDLVTFLRHSPRDSKGQVNPLHGHVQTTLMMGLSQAGRVVRDFLYRGFNERENAPKMKVFDGALVLGAATRPFMNFRFAQPVRPPDKQHGNTLFYPDSSFPFAYEVQKDPLSGREDGILRGCLAKQSCPKVFHVATSNEYWHYKNSQVTTNTLGTTDGALPPEVRAYTLAGMPHAPYWINAKGVAEQPHNDLRYTYLLRNLLEKLRAWSAEGVLPPSSAIPKISDGTLVQVEKLNWPAIPGVTFAGPVLTRHPLFDYGPEFAKGIVKVFPEELKLEYPPLVPQVDRDGNDKAGIQHPAVSVPLATRTGWSIRAAQPGRGQLASQDGSLIAFPRTKEERLLSGDPRLSIQERYSGVGEYERHVKLEALMLVVRGHLLNEDVEKVVSQSLEEWRRIVGP